MTAATSLYHTSSAAYPLSDCYPVPTPPLCSSPLELPPILDLRSHTRPPSPTSPVTMGTMSTHPDEHPSPVSISSVSSVGAAPAFLEPVPMFDTNQYESAFRPDLFPALKERHRLSLSSLSSTSSSASSSDSSNPPSPRLLDRRATTPAVFPHHRKLSFFRKIPALQIPIPRRSSQALPSIKPKPDPEQSNDYEVMSPTMAAASATAASAAIQRHPGSLVADTFLNCLRLPNASVSEDDSALTEDNKRDAAEALACASADTRDQKQASFARVSFMVHGTKKASLGLDTTMFLTKNAHIKRPRNAWIHFRCHYGQALKTQDPTLRAEEISKRASRRWARLTEKEKKPWHDLAEQEKQAHKEAFPEYRYCPKRANSSTTANPSSSSGVYRLGLSSEMDLTADGDTEKKARRRTK